jgi:ABC-type Fe3+-siderophore transport system permease subunit
VLLVVLVWICARYGGPRDIAVANLLVTLPGIPLVVFLYWRRKARWMTVLGGP